MFERLRHVFMLPSRYQEIPPACPGAPPPPHTSVSARPTQPAEHAPSNMHASSCVSSLLHETTMSSFASDMWWERPGRFRTPPTPLQLQISMCSLSQTMPIGVPESGIRRRSIICLGALCCCVVGSVAMTVPRASERCYPAWTAGLTRQS